MIKTNLQDTPYTMKHDYSTFLILLFTGLLGLNSCQTTGVKYPETSPIFGLATPIQLTPEDTRVVLTDYFSQKPSIDSFQVHEGLTLRYDTSSYVCYISKNRAISLPKLTTLKVFIEGVPYSILVKESDKVRHVLKYSKDAFGTDPANTYLSVKGDFSRWNPIEFRKDASGDFLLELDLSPGSYAYKLMLAERKALAIEISDPTNIKAQSNGTGGENNVLIIPRPEAKNAWFKLTDFTKQGIQVKTGEETDIIAFWENFELAPRKIAEGLYEILLPPFAKRDRRSHIRIYGAAGQNEAPDMLIPLFKGKVIADAKKLNRQDFQTNIMYFTMIDRFVNGDPTNDAPLEDSAVVHKANYWGGDLKGITQKIKEGYFDSLGMNTLWLSPIAQNPVDAWGQFRDPDTKFSGYHGYWPISSSKVDHRFGNKEDLEELLDAAHEHNMNVLLDYVANHVHQQHPVYQLHPEWATSLYLPDGSLNMERWEEYRLTTWFDSFMPTLNLVDQQVTNIMVDSALFWLKNYHFDGFRHNATEHIPLNFWRTLNHKIKNDISIPQNRKVYQIGETYGTPELIGSYINLGMLDAQFDFNLYDEAMPAFAYENGNLAHVAQAIEKSLKLYGYHHLMGNITGNQDKPRFISMADGSLPPTTPWQEYKRIGWKQTIPIKDTTGYEKLKLFNALNMTIPGIPIVYYGDEFGMPGAGDPDNRRMMYFDLNKHELEVFNSVKELAKLRRQNMTLMYGDFTIIEATQEVLVFKRSYFKESAYVIINKSDEAYIKEVNGQPFFSCPPMDYSIKFVTNE